MKLMLPVLFAFAMSASAQQPVRWLPESKLWVLQTANTSYVIGINELNQVQNLYWGKRLTRQEDFAPARSTRDYAFESREGMTPEEYPGWGGMRYYEPCLKVTLPSGVRDLVLKYAAHEVRGTTLEVRLKDIQYDLAVTLLYHVYADADIIRKQARIQNGTPQPLTIESAQSGVWYLPAGEGYRLTYLQGRWAGETQVTREPIHAGKKILESRRGNTSHQANPWFAIDYLGQANEEHGRVWFGALGWSGNWKLAIEQTPNQQVRVTGGYNDFDFSYPLQPGETLEMPPFYGGFTCGGFGEMSRILHRFEREHVAPRSTAARPRPVLYNSWEATTFAVNEDGQKQLADKAAKLGVELFVMDDGWFGQRNDDHAGLGDWYVNPQKFPNGLKGLISHVNGLGMKFGLWVEPEMVNPNSDLYRAHPDWAVHFPARPRTEGRFQLILDMSRDEVKEHIFGVLDKLLAGNHIEFLKWDMNRHFTEPGGSKIWVKYVDNVYEIIDRLRARHPGVEIESCSGGGGRVDLNILTRVDQVWTSDNTEAFDRLKIQEGFSMAYPAKVMMDWITDVPNMNGRSTPLKYRFLVAMQGSVGIGANLHHWSAGDFALAGKMVQLYKEIRNTVQHGGLYRLLSPRDGSLTANQYVSADGEQSVLFAFLDAQQFLRPTPTIYLRGLDESALYSIRTIDDKLIGDQLTVSGSFLMHRGLNLNLSGDYDSTALIIEKR